MAADLVHYHHPDDDQFSLDFVNPDPDAIEKRLESYDDATETRVRNYDLNEEVHVIYVKTNDVADAEEIEYDFDRAFAEMDPDTRVIVRDFLGMFKIVRDEQSETRSDSLDAYKEINVEQVPLALDRIEWRGTVSEVGARLASNLILCHALPNANHRTAFSMFERYVDATTNRTYELPSMVTDDEKWQAWVDTYIVDSKRVLTVRRNVGLFRYLSRFGCSTVRRKNNIDIPLSDFDLDLHPHEALSKYARMHERRTSRFAEKILTRTSESHLAEQSGLTKAEFADAIREEIQSRR